MFKSRGRSSPSLWVDVVKYGVPVMVLAGLIAGEWFYATLCVAVVAISAIYYAIDQLFTTAKA